MEPSKIVRLVAVAFAVIAGIITIPESAMIIAVLGLIGGFFVPEDRRLPTMVATLTLALAHGAPSPIPGIGIYLTDILASLSALFNAASCTIVVLALIDRLRA